METRHFYHVYASGRWEDPVFGHAAALAQSGYRGPVTVGLVGTPRDRDRARDGITTLFTAAGAAPDSWIEADSGYEQVTLAPLREYSAAHSGAICYAHTKGAANTSHLTPYWRRSMTRHVIGRWRECVRLLKCGYDTAGCHWLTPERHHQPPLFIVTSPFYGGNFWWATTEYLRRLPPPGTASRYDAEGWIGLGHPTAADLLPGWPTMLLCMSPADREQWRERVTEVRGAATSCAVGDPSCCGPVRWTSTTGGHLNDFLRDAAPLCHSHSLRHDMALGM